MLTTESAFPKNIDIPMRSSNFLLERMKREVYERVFITFEGTAYLYEHLSVIIRC